MNDKIDIIVPWLNANDLHWQKEYNEYLKTQNKGDSSVIRTREWDLFRYFLRSISKNCKWVNKVYVCVYDEHQIPEWLNTEAERIKILYHKDVIPQECLPTYNGLCVENFLLKYPEISNNFIFCDDDMYFVNETKDTDYFRDNKCVKFKEPLTKLNPGNFDYFHKFDLWNKIMQNTVNYKAKITGNSTYYPMYHVPEGFHKSDFIEFYEKHGDDIIKEFSKNESKIRQETNLLTLSIVKYIQLDKEDFVSDNNFVKENVHIDITDYPDWKKIMELVLKCKSVCINDQVYTTNQRMFDDIKNKLTKILDTVFPDKCEFEK